MRDGKLSRRDLLETGAGVLVGAALSTSGCATLPAAGSAPTRHPCDHRHCRWFRLVDGAGRCSLVARARGGEP